MKKLDVGCLDQDFKVLGAIGIDNGSMDDDEARPDVYADANELPFKDNVFDEVYSYSCLGMYTEMKGFKEAARVLKDGGTLTVGIYERFYKKYDHLIKEMGFNIIDLDYDTYDDDTYMRITFKKGGKHGND